MARKPKGTGRRIKTAERMFDERAFVDGVFNDEYILVVGSGVMLDRQQFHNSGGDINQYIIDEINHDRRQEQAGFVDHRSFTDIFRGTPLDEIDPIYSLLTDGYDYALSDISSATVEKTPKSLTKSVRPSTRPASLISSSCLWLSFFQCQTVPLYQNQHH